MATATPTATPADLGPAEPQVDRMLEHISVLSEEIGPRLAGTPDEQRAVDYLSEQLESWGYDVEVQPFEARPGPRAGVFRYSTLAIDAPEQRDIEAISLSGGAAGEASGRLVDVGNGADFPDALNGAIALVQRDVVTFTDMARRALDAGAAGVVVVNKEPGLFPGVIEPPVDLPVIGIDQSDGGALRDLLAGGDVEAAINIRTSVTAHNVVARPASGECRTLSGGHYDSVPWAPGANDNASGAAVVLELARAAAAAGLDGHCFILFGSEELGLIGSRFFVAGLSENAREALAAVYNYDVVASDPEVDLIGDRALAQDALAAAGMLDVDAERAQLPEGASSDQASFLEAGIPALMLTTPDFEFIHTPQDTVATIREEPLLDIASLGFALLQSAE